MEIIEKFVQGKKTDCELCEDLILVTEDYIAVVDGVSSKGNKLFEGKTGGRKTAEIVCEVVCSLDKNATVKEAEKEITRRIASMYADANEALGDAAASAIVFSNSRTEIWSIGDCQCLINGELFAHEKEIDRINSDMRALFLEMSVREGKTKEELLCNDDGRAFIMPILQKQHLFANSEGRFSYGVLNGKTVPDEHIIIHKASDGDEIVLASDGYPHLKDTLWESEKLLEEEIKNNPLCMDDYRTTKGIGKDNLSFDDRAYIRFKV